MIYNPKQLANRLKLIRAKNNLTQTQLAKKVGLKQSTVSSFETNPDTTQLKTFFKIIQALELELDIHQRNTSEPTSADDEIW